MKRVCSILLIVALLTVPCMAVQQEEYTPLQFGTPETVYGISVRYEVETENVAAIDVVFADAVKAYAYFGYEAGELRIGIASVNALDLSEPLGQITATLSDGTTVAPELKLKMLKFNGVKATCNLIPGEAVIAQDGDKLKVSVPVHNDFPIACSIMVAAYDADNRMLACKISEGDAASQDFTVTPTLTGCSSAVCVKVFYLTKTFVHIVGAKTFYI